MHAPQTDHPTQAPGRALCDQKAQIMQQHPDLSPIIDAFGAATEAVADCRAELDKPDLAGFTPDMGLIEQGVPLLDHPAAPAVDWQLDKAAPVMLAALGRIFPSLAVTALDLSTALEQDDFRAQCEALLQSGEVEDLTELGLDKDSSALHFLLGYLGRPALENTAEAMGSLLADEPWTLWNRGTCPICGAPPSMSMLKSGQVEPTEYLQNSSAQRWLCCSGCAHTWRYGRTLCPSCGHDEQENREYLFVEGRNLERVELCAQCHHYLLSMDIRERMTPPDHRLAPLGLMHLDVVARQRGYAPQVETPWNLLAQE